MTMQDARRARLGSQPLPLTWEMPLAIGSVALLLLVMTPLVVQAAATALVAGGPAWPSPTLAGLAGLAAGRFGEGLPPAVAEQLPADTVMWIATVAAELVAVGAVVVLGLWVRALTGGGARRGLASGPQAAAALGITPLRRQAAVVRPDLTHPRLRRLRRLGRRGGR